MDNENKVLIQRKNPNYRNNTMDFLNEVIEYSKQGYVIQDEGPRKERARVYPSMRVVMVKPEETTTVEKVESVDFDNMSKPQCMEYIEAHQLTLPEDKKGVVAIRKWLKEQ